MATSWNRIILQMYPERSRGATLVIYIHGFKSSPLSFKAQYLVRVLASINRSDSLRVPALDYRPKEAIGLLVGLIEQYREDHKITLIGSSLGGYYATFLTEKYGIASVLINPAVAPYRMMAENLGWQQNFHTAERYELTQREVEQLRRLETEQLVYPELYRVYLQTGDETLDYREAAKKYRSCNPVIETGGSHGFDDFEKVVPEILQFAGIKMSDKR